MAGAALEGGGNETKVFSVAQIKFFFNALLGKKGGRRLKVLGRTGIQTTLDQVMADVKTRDEKDYDRPVGGLRKTPQSIVMDHSYLSVEESAEELYKFIQKNPR